MTESGSTAVSLNGADNVGKTTQLRWLSRGMPDATMVGTIDRWDRRWASVAAGDFSRWWFHDSTTEDHVSLVFESHAARRRASRGLVLEDRGYPMLVATCAATAAVKDSLIPDQALRHVETLAARHDIPNCGEVRILLRHNDDPNQEAELAISRAERPPSPTYVAYQRNLATILDAQTRRGDYDLVINRGTDPILTIQRRLRTWLDEHGLPVRLLPAGQPLRLWILGGLSESGKSTVGELLAAEHGTMRMKIGYLLDLAAVRAGVDDPYDTWAPEQQAEALTEEVLRLVHSNKVTGALSLESAHHLAAARHLKRIWGDRCHVAYIAADLATRAERSSESRDSIVARDETKVTRGADRIAELADWVIDNTSSLAALKLNVSRMAADITPKSPVAVGTTRGRLPTPLDWWLREMIGSIVDTRVAAVVATGSTAGSDWRWDWSDIDLLVVRDELPFDWLRQSNGTVPPPDGIKVGISAFTTDEVLALQVPARVIHALRRLAVDGSGLLYARGDLSLPVPTYETYDRASRADLPLVVMRLRRLASVTPPDFRQLYKHVVLTMKLLLAADHVEVSSSDEALRRFNERYPRAGLDMPCLDEIDRREWRSDNELSARLLASAGVILHHHDHIRGRLQRTDGRTVTADLLE